MNASVWVSISGLALYLVVWGVAQRHHRATKKMSQLKRATGSCKVVFEPEDSALDPIASDKEFYGALEAATEREVLDLFDHGSGRSRQTHVERVVGTLDGRSGTFLLTYSGVTDDGISFTVVPGSGTGALNGISGTMTIRIRGREQVYEFEYTLCIPTPRVGSLPQSSQDAPDEQQGDMGRVLMSLPALSVLAISAGQA